MIPGLSSSQGRPKTMRASHTFALASLTWTLLLNTPQKAEALILVTIQQEGNDVVVRSKGEYKTTGLKLTPAGSLPDPILYPTNPLPLASAEISSGFNYLLIGTIGADAYLWEASDPLIPISTPAISPFGTNPNVTPAVSESGGIIGIDGGFAQTYLILPSGSECISEPACVIAAGEARFTGSSFASLGLNPGTYIWSWGSGEDIDNQTFQLDIIPVPGPLPALGGTAAFAWSRRLRRRVKASQRSGTQLTGV